MSRKLDVAIAKALGKDVRWKKIVPGIGRYRFADADPDERRVTPWIYIGSYRVCEVPHYSTDGNAMRKLIRSMRTYGWVVRLFGYKAAFSAGYKPMPGRDEYRDVPEAVAHAAYKTLTGKEWSG